MTLAVCYILVLMCTFITLASYTCVRAIFSQNADDSLTTENGRWK